MFCNLQPSQTKMIFAVILSVCLLLVVWCLVRFASKKRNVHFVKISERRKFNSEVSYVELEKVPIKV